MRYQVNIYNIVSTSYRICQVEAETREIQETMEESKQWHEDLLKLVTANREHACEWARENRRKHESFVARKQHDSEVMDKAYFENVKKEQGEFEQLLARHYHPTHSIVDSCSGHFVGPQDKIWTRQLREFY